MNNSISRQAAIDSLDGEITVTGEDNARAVQKYIRDISKKIRNLPSIQSEIIRCKDCAYSHMTYSGDCKNCDIWEVMYDSGESLYLKGDFFCAFGKRKETNGSD